MNFHLAISTLVSGACLLAALSAVEAAPKPAEAPRIRFIDVSGTARPVRLAPSATTSATRIPRQVRIEAKYRMPLTKLTLLKRLPNGAWKRIARASGSARTLSLTIPAKLKKRPVPTALASGLYRIDTSMRSGRRQKALPSVSFAVGVHASMMPCIEFDTDGDLQLSDSEFAAYIEDYRNSDLSADLNQDGLLTTNDIEIALTCFGRNDLLESATCHLFDSDSDFRWSDDEFVAFLESFWNSDLSADLDHDGALTKSDTDQALVCAGRSLLPECADGIDNDLDGFVDAGYDPGCSNLLHTTEGTGETCNLYSPDYDEGLCEIASLGRLKETFKPICLEALESGDVINGASALQVSDLRGKSLDLDPPTYRDAAPTYAANRTDTFAPTDVFCASSAPYVPQGILPFAMRYFENTFEFGGWHANRMADCMASLGFRRIRAVSEPHRTTAKDVLPEQTTWQRILGDPWPNVMSALGLPWTTELIPGSPSTAFNRFDLLGTLNEEALLSQLHASWQTLAHTEPYYGVMVDLEKHVFQTEAELRQAPWFQFAKGSRNDDELVRDYFRGVQRYFTIPAAVLKELGVKDVSLYGQQPFNRTWTGSNAEPDPADSVERYAYFALPMYEAFDTFNISLYNFYRVSQNTAYTLANSDANILFRDWLAALGLAPKAIRPYFWNQYHGGGGGDRWWKLLPIASEEMAAQTFFQLMNQIDGITLWNSAGATNPHVVSSVVPRSETNYGGVYVVGAPFPFTKVASGSDDRTAIKRYDVISVVSKAGAYVYFKFVDTAMRSGSGIPPTASLYRAREADMAPSLISRSEGVSGVVEGLALGKPIEFVLRNGAKVVTTTSYQQFMHDLPITRRIDYGRYSVVGAYSPKSLYGDSHPVQETASISFDTASGEKRIDVVADKDLRFYVFDNGLCN